MIINPFNFVLCIPKNSEIFKIKNRKVQLDKWTNSLYAHGSPNSRPVPNSKLLTPVFSLCSDPLSGWDGLGGT